MEVDSSSEKLNSQMHNLTCQLCDKNFPHKRGLNEHTKKNHNKPSFENNLNHSQNTDSSDQSDFRYPPLNPIPPNQPQSMMDTLTMVLKKMEVMEEFFQKITTKSQ